MRIDNFLANSGLAHSRTFAKTLIEGGYVQVNGKTVIKCSFDVSEGDDVKVTGRPYEYVSRGGVKLEGALDAFQIDVTGLAFADIGASSGGFTDCLLQRGAKKIFAVDSGSGQLNEKLKADSRVVSMEGVNARNLTVEDLGEECDGAVCDVSFISQTLIIPAISGLIKDGGIYVGLVKPQFECGRAALSKGGIVKDKKEHQKAIKSVLECAEDCGLGAMGLCASPIFGGDGNREFLLHFIKGAQTKISNTDIKKVCGL